MSRLAVRVAPLGVLLAALAACSVHMAPVVAADPTAPCPGGSAEWRLEITDQRADKKSVSDAATPIRDSIVRSLPGCRWTNEGAPTITIEVHTLKVALEDYWEAAVEWDVIVRDRQGRTVTQFEADSRVSRPNYRGVDNEKAAVQQALNEAMQRTLAGLRSVSIPG
jgi:hypothetical protein